MTDPITRPPKPARWTSDPDPGFAGALEPSEGKKDDGWQNGEAPAAGHMNWLLQQHAHWLRYLDTIAGEQAVDAAALAAEVASNIETDALANQVDVSIAGVTDQFEAFAISSDTGTIVAVGENGTIKRTFDFGRTWDDEAAPGGFTGTYKCAAYGAGRFVIAGTSGEIHYSPDDGENWIDVATGVSVTWDAVAYNGTRFVACGSSPGMVFWSNDGSSWTAASFGGSSSEPSSLAHNGTRFVLGARDGGIWTSDNNGSTWTSRSYGGGPVHDVTYSAALGFVAVTNANIYTSADGTTWSVYLAAEGYAARGTATACYVFHPTGRTARGIYGNANDRLIPQPTDLTPVGEPEVCPQRVALLQCNTPRASCFMLADGITPGKIFRSAVWSPPP